MESKNNLNGLQYLSMKKSRIIYGKCTNQAGNLLK